MNTIEINDAKLTRRFKIVIFGDGKLPTFSTAKIDEAVIKINADAESNEIPLDENVVTETEESSMVDVLEFLLYCCADLSPNDGIMKALGVMRNLTDATIEDFYNVSWNPCCLLFPFLVLSLPNQ